LEFRRVLFRSIPLSSSLFSSPRFCSEGFHPRPEIELMRPGIARLAVDLPIGFRDVIGIQDPVLLFQRIARRKIVADEGRVDRAVDDRMCDMDALRSKL